MNAQEKDRWLIFCNHGMDSPREIETDFSSMKVIPILTWEEPTAEGPKILTPIFESIIVARDFTYRLKRQHPEIVKEADKWVMGTMLVLQEHYDLLEGVVELSLMRWPRKITHPLNVHVLEVAEEPSYHRVYRI